MRQVLKAEPRKGPTLPTAKRGAKSWRQKGPRAQLPEAEMLRPLSVLAPHFLKEAAGMGRAHVPMSNRTGMEAIRQ